MARQLRTFVTIVAFVFVLAPGASLSAQTFGASAMDELQPLDMDDNNFRVSALLFGDAFYQGFLTSALAADEMLTEIRVPKMNGAGWSFQKFNRRAQDWAIVGVSAWRRNGDSGVALVNMASTPVLATSVTSALAGGASVEDAAEQAAAEADPQADLNASVEYRTHLAKVLVKRALNEATG